MDNPICIWHSIHTIVLVGLEGSSWFWRDTCSSGIPFPEHKSSVSLEIFMALKLKVIQLLSLMIKWLKQARPIMKSFKGTTFTHVCCVSWEKRSEFLESQKIDDDSILNVLFKYSHGSVCAGSSMTPQRALNSLVYCCIMNVPFGLPTPKSSKSVCIQHWKETCPLQKSSTHWSSETN